jgi:hypothetical protein
MISSKLRHLASQIEKPYIDSHLSGKDTIVIDMFEVPPNQRHKGVGTQFYKNWEKSLPKHIKYVKVFAADTGEGNSDAFWDKLGFDYMYDGEENEMDYESAHTMIKTIQ